MTNALVEDTVGAHTMIHITGRTVDLDPTTTGVDRVREATEATTHMPDGIVVLERTTTGVDLVRGATEATTHMPV